jgi:hypothetical protein
MYRVGLLAVLLLAVVAAANVTLTCTVESRETVDTTDTVSVSFDFTSIAPVFPNKGIRFTNNLIYSPVDSAQWDRQLEFRVILEHYAPNQRWRIDRYKCVYNNSGNVEVGYYDVLAQRPERRTTTVTFRVPPTAAEHSGSTSVKVSQPLEDIYCSAPPTLDSWPRCPTTRAEDNKVTVEPPEWRALQVNGRRPRDVVKAYGVNATIPDPWVYGVKSQDVGTLSYVEVDGSRHGPDVRNAPVKSSVYLYMVGMPTRWGEVKIRRTPNMPVYVLKFVRSFSDPPPAFCRPPTCIVMDWANITQLKRSCDRHGGQAIIYDALVAVQSGYTISEWADFFYGYPVSDTGYRSNTSPEIYLPLGSVYLATVRVLWSPFDFNIYLINRFDDSSGTPYLRLIRSNTYYEDVASRGKVNGPLEISGPGWYSRETKVAVAVDRSVRSIELGAYVWPVPLFWGRYTPVITRQTYSFYCISQNREIQVWLTSSIWPTDGLLRNHPDISGGRYVDMLRLLYGEPVVYYWGQGDQYGAVSVHTDRRYGQTTADAAGQARLYHVTGIAPTDAGMLDISWSMPQTIGGGGGGGGGGTNEVTPWLVWLVPTTACRSMFCTTLHPELVGPLPPFSGDKALPNFGYSFMLLYVGEAGRRRVKVYVEDGYVISGPPIDVSRAQNYKLVEIDKEWRPFEAVIVGPGWWVPYQRLSPCETMPIRALSIYATPDRTGFFKITVEDSGVNTTYVFYVTNDVGYRISVRTPAPESVTAIPFNMTAHVMLGGVPYYHALYGYGEGGRLSPPACLSTWFSNYPASQLYVSGDFWGSFGLTNTLLKPVSIRYNYTKPWLELVEPWRGLVRVRADGPVSGFAFYAQRGGTWVKIGEAAGSCLLVNASRIFPWDPILVLPLVEQELTARPGDVVAIWRPETALLFKTWADVVGYPKGARSVLTVVRRC